MLEPRLFNSALNRSLTQKEQQKQQEQHCRLLLFLRYPEPGHTKTRLIPALGATGAAQLQRHMAEYLIERLQHPGWQIQVHFTGARLAKMHDWLGPRLSYHTQVQGDLGDRIWAGFQQAFEEGRSQESTEGRVIAIGADCPELSTRHIQQAFQDLMTKDVVLGPAEDGGYYLIGLRQQAGSNPSLKALFQGIAWSTPHVFQQTRSKAQQLGLSLAQLETLSDIDRPSDLAIWDQLKNNRLQNDQRQNNLLRNDPLKNDWQSIYSIMHNP
ncbi:MAG: TIGR04282 family arsenosugar biosynthesis glycosyltransferase [Cyanobacteria bacterium P01_F01_bin.53]